MTDNNVDKVEREKFANKFEYFLTSLSYAVGLGNVWRFPYLCYKNGGGTFFVPYLISLAIVGLSFFFLESALGQYSSQGPMGVWIISPLFKGIGLAMFVMNMYVGIYYNIVVAWAIYFLYATFTKLPGLPWSDCNNQWNTKYCHILKVNSSDENNKLFKSPSDEFFHRHVLQMSDGIEELGSLNYRLVICLMIAWILMFFAISKGVKGLGKVSYFTAMFPYIMITILLGRGASLEGAINGIEYYIVPKWDKIWNVSVWSDAASQIFFSLSICMGGVITLSSYNPVKNNCLKDSLLITLCNSLTSIYAGFAIFSIIGFMATDLNQSVDKVVDQGVGLAFIAYPSALSLLPVSPLWSCLFFLMILTLGFGSEMTLIEAIVITIVDQQPDKLRHRKVWVLLVVCIIMFLAGLFMCTNGGIYILQLMDTYCVPYSALFIALFEVTVVAWVYGIDNFMDNIKEMIGFYPFPRLYWKIIYKFAAPIIIITLLVLQFVFRGPTTYGEYQYPVYAEAIGWLLCVSSIIFIPIIALYQVFTSNLPIIEAIKCLIKPTGVWVKNSETNNVNQPKQEVSTKCNKLVIQST
ncbi:sodium- and chloride-dependent glycine transporter 2-like [Oppia nitens]|uniref:sodium- and chloride-dependent glycine transporter 2-like n=1 Tax=Oppia nitens TaxID=1686743 RepID=UPI0023DA1FB5|nr:sodium- and chloride-dependent glycine transporter 2-like [Oppia nitens]